MPVRYRMDAAASYPTLGEGCRRFYSMNERFDGTSPAVIWLHGIGGTGLGSTPVAEGSGVSTDHLRALAEAGFIVYSIDAGGTATYGNDTAMAAVTAAYNHAVANGAAGTKVHILGASMGGCVALNWVKRNPTKVRSCWVWCPVTHLAEQELDPSWQVAIDTGYGGSHASFLATYSGHDPYEDVAVTAATGVRIHIMHGDQDTTVPIAHSISYVAAANNPKITMETLVGASHAGVLACSTDDTVRFFRLNP